MKFLKSLKKKKKLPPLPKRIRAEPKDESAKTISLFAVEKPLMKFLEDCRKIQTSSPITYKGILEDKYVELFHKDIHPGIDSELLRFMCSYEIMSREYEKHGLIISDRAKKNYQKIKIQFENQLDFLIKNPKKKVRKPMPSSKKKPEKKITPPVEELKAKPKPETEKPKRLSKRPRLSFPKTEISIKDALKFITNPNETVTAFFLQIMCTQKENKLSDKEIFVKIKKQFKDCVYPYIETNISVMRRRLNSHSQYGLKLNEKINRYEDGKAVPELIGGRGRKSGILKAKPKPEKKKDIPVEDLKSTTKKAIPKKTSPKPEKKKDIPVIPTEIPANS